MRSELGIGGALRLHRTATLAGAGAAIALAVAALPGRPAHADRGGATLPDGRKAIHLIAGDGSSVKIGHVDLKRDGAGARIAVKLDGKDLTDEFLSMRPFRCLSRPKQMWCHLAYPYAIEDHIKSDDLRDLEYRLMFLWRPYDKVGVDAWNGLYFKLEQTADGFAGALHEADYNVLAVPPEDGVKRPVLHQDLSEAQPGQHSFDRIEIR